MALHELTFTSANARDEIQAWIYTPAKPARAVVQLIHGLGEHSRRYIHLITTLLDAGFVVAADDHAGHGRTAMKSGVWQDAGEDPARVVVEDELRLRDLVSERFPDLPYVVFGHSWGSMIARVFASRRPEGLAGLAICGVVSQMKGLENEAVIAGIDAAIAENGGESLDTTGVTLGLFEGVLDRYVDVQGPTDWVAVDRGVIADHATDPYNNFGAPMTLRFARGFIDLYQQATGPEWAPSIPKELPVLLLSGDQDPTANFGEGTYHVANSLWTAGLRNVRTRIYTGLRHEVHNEPASRADVEAEIVAFVEHCIGD